MAIRILSRTCCISVRIESGATTIPNRRVASTCEAEVYPLQVRRVLESENDLSHRRPELAGSRGRLAPVVEGILSTARSSSCARRTRQKARQVLLGTAAFGVAGTCAQSRAPRYLPITRWFRSASINRSSPSYSKSLCPVARGYGTFRLRHVSEGMRVSKDRVHAGGEGILSVRPKAQCCHRSRRQFIVGSVYLQ